MFRIGIDVGSSYVKYCVMSGATVLSLSMEKTPIRQKEYFEKKITKLQKDYPNALIVSCGYGKNNVTNIKHINELTALARGVYLSTNQDSYVLDIGGQDTKLIVQEKGKLTHFFINDKCAAGSGLFLSSILNMVGMTFDDIRLSGRGYDRVDLSSTCAVFAQSEVVELIADNYSEEEIIYAVIWQILSKAKSLLAKVDPKPIILSGGLSQIEGIAELAEKVLERNCKVVDNGAYFASIGCAIYNVEE